LLEIVKNIGQKNLKQKMKNLKHAFEIKEKLKTDVLVIGGGGAALRAALAAKDMGLDVLIISKGEIGKSGATYSSSAEIGAFNVPDGIYDSQDNQDVFYKDIMDASMGIANPKLVRVLVDEAIEAKVYLKKNGLQFAKTSDGRYIVYKACFSSKARSYVVENHFKPVLKILFSLVKNRNIHCISGLFVTNLIVKQNTCFGAFALSSKGKRVIIYAKSTIIATGGAGNLFLRNMNPQDITGDGYAMAHRAGAKITNMEFMQAGIGLAYPRVNLFGNQLWEAMPRLTNGNGETFLKKYIDGPYSEEEVITAKKGHFPFSSRDISRYVEISIQKEINEGITNSRGNVYLDFLSTNFKRIFKLRNSTFKETWPISYKNYKKLGIDLYFDKIEIACFAHAINGGVIIDVNGQTTIEGLFAAGETVSGPHGADRLGGNMVVACQVFGKRAGQAAANHALSISSSLQNSKLDKNEDEFLKNLGSKNIEEIQQMLKLLKKSADDSLLIIRNKVKLDSFLDIIKELKLSLNKPTNKFNQVNILNLIELRNLLDTGKLITKAALSRKESRGSHYRSDFPSLDCSMEKPIISN